MNTFPNWFEGVHAPQIFQHNLKGLFGKKIDVLQIGAYTGDATEWMLKYLLTHPESTLTDVDTWEGSDEEQHHHLNWSAVESRYMQRHASSIEAGKLIKHKMPSDEFFASVVGDKKYDFIYVDGDHKASAVLRDGINSIEHLKQGGIIAFDDYNWTLGKGIAFDPKPAIEAIAICYSDILQVTDVDYQMWLTHKG